LPSPSLPLSIPVCVGLAGITLDVDDFKKIQEWGKLDEAIDGVSGAE